MLTAALNRHEPIEIEIGLAATAALLINSFTRPAVVSAPHGCRRAVQRIARLQQRHPAQASECAAGCRG
ncbi:hypothetical protein M8494_06485 [Serratia ureilytica]